MTNGSLAASYLAKATLRLDSLAELSRWLRENRELASYGDDDFIPTERYTCEDARRAIDGARLAVSVAVTVIGSGRE